MDRTYAQALAALLPRLPELWARPTDELTMLAAQARRLARNAPFPQECAVLTRVGEEASSIVANRERGDSPFGCPPDELPF